VAQVHRKLIDRRWVGFAVVAALTYGFIASFTRPFTWPADVVISIPLALAAVTVGLRTWQSQPPSQTGVDHPLPPLWDRGWLPWALTIGAVVAWELFTFVSAPRSAHPTLSILINLLDSSHLGKTMAVAVWLALGWNLVDR
jgi:hypothetical protein